MSKEEEWIKKNLPAVFIVINKIQNKLDSLEKKVNEIDTILAEQIEKEQEKIEDAEKTLNLLNVLITDIISYLAENPQLIAYLLKKYATPTKPRQFLL